MDVNVSSALDRDGMGLACTVLGTRVVRRFA